MNKSLISFLLFSLLVLLSHCKVEEENLRVEKLKLLSKFRLKITEPSGLTFDKANNTLWTVSDNNSTIYEISLEGKILNYFTIDGFDIEGITIIEDTLLAFVLEGNSNVVKLNKYGKELGRFKVDLSKRYNEGLEGIAYNPNNKNLYLINEKNPGLLIKIDSNNNILSKKKLNFATDFSGVFFDDNKNQLWIISDEAKSVFKCDDEGKIINKYRVDIPQIEGIAIDFIGNKLFLVSDQTETLYIYNLP